MLSKLVNFPVRVFRHVLLDRSYETYYSADIWERKYKEESYDLGDPKEDGRYGALMQVLRRYDRGPMLDLGCGDGLLWKNYRPLSNSLLTGVDYSETAVEKANARALPNTEFHTADYRTFVPQQKFAAVIFNESLYYIDDFAGAIAKAESWLDDRGVVVVSMFDTMVTRRIWKRLLTQRKCIQWLTINDRPSKLKWTICVFPGTGGARP